MQIEPVKRKSLKAGLITESVIADSDYPVDACYAALIVLFFPNIPFLSPVKF